MTLVACMQYVKGLVASTSWPAAILALPNPPDTLQVNLTPPNPNVISSSPNANVWFFRFAESRDQTRLRVGTVPRASYAGGPSGTKGVDHTITIYFTWQGVSFDPNVDTLWPGMVDAIRSNLRSSADPVIVTDPWTGEQSWVIDVGEVMDGQTDLEALAPQRELGFQCLLTCQVTEVLSA